MFFKGICWIEYVIQEGIVSLVNKFSDWELSPDFIKEPQAVASLML
ncbi:hypothetical protein CLU96_0001 [Chryseobacterium sp. 52]|nr:hypothetical protein CLU96_0001 [Chryseobacterium sp. 52]